MVRTPLDQLSKFIAPVVAALVGLNVLAQYFAPLRGISITTTPIGITILVLWAVYGLVFKLFGKGGFSPSDLTTNSLITIASASIAGAAALTSGNGFVASLLAGIQPFAVAVAVVAGATVVAGFVKRQ